MNLKFLAQIEEAIRVITPEDIAKASAAMDSKALGADDTVVGVLPEELIRLECAASKLSDEIGQFAEAAEKKFQNFEKEGKLLSEEELLSVGMKVRDSLKKLETWKKFFWNCVRAEFGLESEGSVGLRTGWKVVKTLDPVCPNCKMRHPKAPRTMVIGGAGVDPFPDPFGGKLHEA